jgi:hypothetical protein
LQNTHNGDQIEVEGSSYVVQSVVLQFKLVRGKYRQVSAGAVRGSVRG